MKKEMLFLYRISVIICLLISWNLGNITAVFANESTIQARPIKKFSASDDESSIIDAQNQEIQNLLGKIEVLQHNLAQLEKKVELLDKSLTEMKSAGVSDLNQATSGSQDASNDIEADDIAGNENEAKEVGAANKIVTNKVHSKVKNNDVSQNNVAGRVVGDAVKVPAGAAKTVIKSGDKSKEAGNSDGVDAFAAVADTKKDQGQKSQNPKTQQKVDQKAVGAKTNQVPDEKKSYDLALASLKDSKFEEAEQKFSVFIKNFPQSALQSKAYFWYGESFYKRNIFDKAAISYLKGYKQDPKGSKAADSLLKLALSLGSLKKKQDACAMLSKLESEYPNRSADSVKKAKDAKIKFGCN